MRQFFYGDDNMAERKNFLIRTSSLLLAAVFLMTAGMFTLPLSETDAAVMRNQGGIYLNEALSRTSVNGFLESRQQWQMTLDNYSVTDYYLGTPFSDWAYGASPYGDKWQFNEGYGNIMTPLGGNSVDGSMNCTGFLWHIISKSISENSGLSMSQATKGVPILGHFNEQGFTTYSAWADGGGRWYDFINDNSIHYYEFNTKSEMLQSGVLQKGDIIWCVDGTVGTLMDGLKTPADDHHVGIYMGSGADDLWWQSGPIYGDGDTRDQQNSINPIYGCSKSNTYIVLPWSGEGNISTEKSGLDYTTASRTSGWNLCDAFYMASQGACPLGAQQWQTFIDYYGYDSYYKGTPYIDWVFASSPRGDKWQMNEWSASEMLKVGGTYADGGLNCMGFVWHAIAKAMADVNGMDIVKTGEYVPFSSSFNGLGLSRKCWTTPDGRSGWVVFSDFYTLNYYEFATKSDMLNSGLLHKGDIIWCVDGSVGKGLSGLRTLADNHHIGIYMGNGYNDLWWQSGPIHADGDLYNVGTEVCPIYGAASKNTYVVLPWGSSFSNALSGIVTKPYSITSTTTTTTTSTTTTTTTSTTTKTTTSAPITTTTTAKPTTESTTSTTSATTAETTTTSTAATTLSTTESTTTITETSATETETVTTAKQPIVLKGNAADILLSENVKPEFLIESAYITDDYGEVINFEPDELSFGRDRNAPDVHFIKDGDIFRVTFDVYYGDILVGSPEAAHILKGDVNNDSVVNAIDASIVLTYYASISANHEYHLTTAGEPVTSELMEILAFMAGDIDTESQTHGKGADEVLNALDATRILTFYAKQSAGVEISWSETIN